jgi:hypothetical protein
MFPTARVVNEPWISRNCCFRFGSYTFSMRLSTSPSARPDYVDGTSFPASYALLTRPDIRRPYITGCRKSRPYRIAFEQKSRVLGKTASVNNFTAVFDKLVAKARNRPERVVDPVRLF